MTEEDIQVRLCQEKIVKLDLQIKALVQDIHECANAVTLQDYNHQAQQHVHKMKTCIKQLERLAQEQDKEDARQAMLSQAQSHLTQLTATQGSLRRANLASQLSLQKQQKSALLGENPGPRHRGRSDKEGLADTASNITENLMNISRLMSSEVQRSQTTMESLVGSSKQIEDTHEEFQSMTGHIQSSKKLLTKYGRRECTDKLLIFLALVFFFATVLYIVKKRIFYASEDIQ
eukprot:GHVU01003958.1.p1 GENE.GHVU01003958.1~~GHVU01003958.1.p1  ORF type:complete len:232 (-),score=28.57 GHVU01003958.1:262-957(-)